VGFIQTVLHKMRKISANYILAPQGRWLKNGIIVLDDNLQITELIDTKGVMREIPKLEFYSGILTPAFVNAHCHLELSHLRNKIRSLDGGLPDFVSQIMKMRSEQTSQLEIAKAARRADIEMFNNGIAAVADISNTTDSFDVKNSSSIYYHTFIEILGVESSKKEKAFLRAENLKIALKKNIRNADCSITPHALYSVGRELLELINDYVIRNKSAISIHFNESRSEQEMLLSKSGKLFETLKKAGVDFSEFEQINASCVEFLRIVLKNAEKILLVHNTFSDNSSISYVLKHFTCPYFVICPNSNLFIENALPPLNLLIARKAKICIGTDSLASNYSLSVFDEMKTILRYFPEIELKTMLEWATINGAEALNIQQKFGSFEAGKSPGVNLISNINVANSVPQINANSLIKRLL